jgi:hypothetical protein
VGWLWVAVAALGVPAGALLPMLIRGVPADMPCGDEPGPSDAELSAFDLWSAVGLVAGVIAIVLSLIGTYRTVPHEPSVGRRWVVISAVGVGLIGLVLAIPVFTMAAGPLPAVIVLGPFAAGFLTARDRAFRNLGYVVSAGLVLLAYAGNQLWGAALC